jgi:hypothetical protein
LILASPLAQKAEGLFYYLVLGCGFPSQMPLSQAIVNDLNIEH